MSSKRKSGASDAHSRKNKKVRKNGKRKEDDLSDFDDEFKTDASNDGSDASIHDEEDLSDDLAADDGLVSTFIYRQLAHVIFIGINRLYR